MVANVIIKLKQKSKLKICTPQVCRSCSGEAEDMEILAAERRVFYGGVDQVHGAIKDGEEPQVSAVIRAQSEASDRRGEEVIIKSRCAPKMKSSKWKTVER